MNVRPHIIIHTLTELAYPMHMHNWSTMTQQFSVRNGKPLLPMDIGFHFNSVQFQQLFLKKLMTIRIRDFSLYGQVFLLLIMAGSCHMTYSTEFP